jgi:3-hydroxybutyryl-CoA dehydrogenase
MLAMANEIRKVGVVGLGTMGAGIAQVSVQAGYETVGREVNDELGERGKATIDRYLTRGVEKERLTQDEKDAALGRLTLTTELADLAGCDLVIEAVLEELPLKREVFAELDRLTRPEAILATNTSALSVAEIAEATKRPERVVGMHFFNPAPVLPLVEIVRAPKSSEEAMRAAYAWAEGAGKQPVNCNDTPGFIVNRILIPLLNDCVRVLDEAGVTPEDLDKAMTNGAGWPMGPCALVDLVGIDVHIHASEALYDKLGEERMAPPEQLLQLQKEGRLGRKSGRGFFQYETGCAFTPPASKTALRSSGLAVPGGETGFVTFSEQSWCALLLTKPSVRLRVLDVAEPHEARSGRLYPSKPAARRLRSGVASHSSTAWREKRQWRPSFRPGRSPFAASERTVFSSTCNSCASCSTVSTSGPRSSDAARPTTTSSAPR